MQISLMDSSDAAAAVSASIPPSNLYQIDIYMCVCVCVHKCVVKSVLMVVCGNSTQYFCLSCYNFFF